MLIPFRRNGTKEPGRFGNHHPRHISEILSNFLIDTLTIVTSFMSTSVSSLGDFESQTESSGPISSTNDRYQTDTRTTQVRS